MYDILIRNGVVVDGSGRPMYRADVAINEDRIAAVGDLSHAHAERIIEADGKYVVPGFVDVNNHSDTYWQLFADPDLESLLRQGVTTIVGGNSGSSLAPLTDRSVIRSIQKWTDVEKINFNWLSMEEFLAETEHRRPRLNFATLVGHGTIRRGAMKDETRTITPDEIDVMQSLLKQSLKEGAVGLSTGLKYTHARGTGIRELIALTKTVVGQKGIYATYVRDEEEGLVKSVEEAITVARETGAPLHISHLKAVGEKNWHLMDEALNLIETAALNDIKVTFDVYPYTTTGSVLYTLLPEWVTQDGRKMMLERLRDTQVRSAVIRDMKKRGTDYSQILVSTSTLSKMMTHRKISDIALLQGKSPEETVVDFLIASAGRAIVSMEVLSPRNVRRAVQHPFSIISSNGVGYNVSHKETGDLVHPRNFGTFPKVLAQYVREEKALSWEEAIHKMSGKPAMKFSLEKRGMIGEGYYADIAVLDPETVKDNATMEDPYQYPDGISHVIINGRLSLENGVLVGERAGTVLKRKKKLFEW
jgi:N-acyl-D-aspartate/D-glutamate deacylase